MLSPQRSEVSRIGERIGRIVDAEEIDLEASFWVWKKNVNYITKIDMPRIRLFVDSSALMAGILSDQGGARALLMLSENEKIDLLANRTGIVEIERNIPKSSKNYFRLPGK
jgi:hypothetical protein